MATKPAYGTPLNTVHSLYSGLKARYLLNDGSGTTPDDSGPGALHGTTLGSPTWATGSDGQMALTFGSSGNQTVRIPSGINSGISGQLTLLFRLKPSNVSPSPDGTLFQDWAGGAANLMVKINSGKVALSMGNGASGSSNYSSTGSIANNTVQNLIVTRSGTGYEIYLDGSLIGSTTTSDLGGLTSNQVAFGGTNNADSGYGYRGVIEEVAIWNRVLTSGEIAELQSDPYAGYVSGAPTISGISPTSGPFGTLVTITGTYLDTVTGLTLNGNDVIYRVESSTEITAVIDENAETGVFEATNAVGSGTSGTFTSNGGGGGGPVRPSVGWQWPLDA